MRYGLELLIALSIFSTGALISVCITDAFRLVRRRQFWRWGYILGRLGAAGVIMEIVWDILIPLTELPWSVPATRYAIALAATGVGFLWVVFNENRRRGR